MMWHGLKVEVLSFKHQPSHRYLNLRQEYRTFKSADSRPCDWLFLILAMRARGASLVRSYKRVSAMDLSLFQQSHVTIDGGFQPLMWWKEHQAKFPTVFFLTCQILGTPGRQIETERIFCGWKFVSFA